MISIGKMFYTKENTSQLFQKNYIGKFKICTHQQEKREQKKEYAYSGVFTHSCGYKMTFETRHGAHNSGEYTYAKCSNSKCKGTYIKLEIIENEIMNLMSNIRIKEEYIKDVKKALLELHKIQSKENETIFENVNKALIENKKKFDTLLEKLLNGVIDDNLYKKKQNELLEEKDNLEIKLNSHKKISDDFIKLVENLIELTKEAPQLYSSATPTKKREMLKLIISNPTIKDGNISYELNPVFEKVINFNSVLKTRDEGIRTLGGASPAQSFQDCTLNHSDTSLYLYYLLFYKNTTRK